MFQALAFASSRKKKQNLIMVVDISLEMLRKRPGVPPKPFW